MGGYVKAKHTPQSWSDCDVVWNNTGCRKLAHNTWLIRISITDHDGYDYAIKLHDTWIIEYKKNGDIKLNTGGWYTRLTTSRMNQFSPLLVWRYKDMMSVGASSKSIYHMDVERFDREITIKTYMYAHRIYSEEWYRD